MAYDEKLADLIRQAVGPREDVTEKKMFGGVAFVATVPRLPALLAARG